MFKRPSENGGRANFLLLFRQNGRYQFFRTVVGQAFGHGTAECVGIGGRGLGGGFDDDGAVGMADQSVEGQKAVFHHAISRQRYLAASVQRACKGAFGGNAGGGFFMVQRTQDVGKVGASGGDFDAQCALPCRG